MDTKNIVAEVAIRGNTIASAILYSGVPKWLIRLFFGENALSHIIEIDYLTSTEQWRKNISKELFSDLS